MQVSDIIADIHANLFNEHLFDSIFSAYHDEAQRDAGLSLSEAEYSEAKKLLPSLLNETQSDRLSEAEHLCLECAKWLMQFAFTRGCFTGFHQCFLSDSLAAPFQSLVFDQVMQHPGMERYPVYNDQRTEILNLFTTVKEGLSDAAAEHVTGVELAWQERFLGILRHSFHLGYRCALACVDDVSPSAGSYSIIDKVLTTEHELCFTQTVAERERKSNPQRE